MRTAIRPILPTWLLAVTGLLCGLAGGADTGDGDRASVARVATAVPVITSSTAATGTVGTLFSYQITASEDPTSFDAAGLPAGLAVDPVTGVISGTPQVAGVSLVTLRATNGLGTGSATLSLTVSGSGVTVPVISSPGSANALVGVPFSYQIAASGSPTGFNASGLPSGLQIDLLSGVISGTPVAAGTSFATISASNAAGTGSAPLNIVVSDPGVVTGAPVISSATAATAYVGSLFSYQIVASQQPTSYSANGLPSGLALDPATGAITGTPVTAGTYPVTLGAANSLGSGSQTTTITVAAAGTTPPPSSGYGKGSGSCGAGAGLSALLLALLAALRLGLAPRGAGGRRP